MQQTEFTGRVFVDLPGLHRARKERGLTMRELAEQAGVGYVTIHRIEVGKNRPQVHTAKKLAKALRMDLTDLVVPPQEERSD